jgi:Tol biopolymer transport system component
VERLTTNPNGQTAHSFSPDGKRLVFGEGSTADLQVLSMEGERTSQPLFQSQFNETKAMISPDGHWIAYESNESGRQIYVRPFPNVEAGKWQISRDGGQEPVWAPRGQELFYRNGEAMMVVGIKTEPTFLAGSPVVLFTGGYLTNITGVTYDISPDGQRFLMIKAAEEEGGQQGQINVVLNWFKELKRLVPTP